MRLRNLLNLILWILTTTRSTTQLSNTSDIDDSSTNSEFRMSHSIVEKLTTRTVLLFWAILSSLVTLTLAVAVIILVLQLKAPGESTNSISEPNEDYQQLPTSKLGIFRKAAVVSDAHGCASHGKRALKMGGTAVDAALATLFCNGAVHSHSMGLGGGFFMVYYNKTSGESHFLNAREVAPMKASKLMYVNKTEEAKYGSKSIAVPGEVKGYFEAKKKYGNPNLSMLSLMEKTIDMCKNGIKTTRSLERAIAKTFPKYSGIVTKMWKDTFMPNGKGLKRGQKHFRPALAKTLELLGKNGTSDPFYFGELGEGMIKEVKELGGVLTMEDLNNYKVRWEETEKVPMSSNLTILTSGSPSSGLVTAFIIKMMDTLISKKKVKADSEVLKLYQAFVESMKYGFAARSHLGDLYKNGMKNVTEQTIKNLKSDDWSEEIMKRLTFDKTFNDADHYDEAVRLISDDHGTTHINVLAPNGDAVSVTSTVNYYFGSKVMTKSGIILNDEMDDFATDPNKPNIYGINPSPSNYIAPGRRPQSSMSPTVVVNTTSKEARLVIGASGGPNIISTVAFVAMQNLFLGKNIKDAIDEPRVHHQLLPMTLRHEKRMNKAIVQYFAKLGHKVKEFDPYFDPDSYAGGRVQAIAKNPRNLGIVTANNDRRKSGSTDGF